MPMFKVAVMVVWLSNTDGSIVAHTSGAAVDVSACQRLAAEIIADESSNPNLEGSTAKFSCWTTSTKVQPQKQKPTPGSVQL
jgi:hypothetical protein